MWYLWLVLFHSDATTIQLICNRFLISCDSYYNAHTHAYLYMYSHLADGLNSYSLSRSTFCLFSSLSNRSRRTYCLPARLGELRWSWPISGWLSRYKVTNSHGLVISFFTPPILMCLSPYLTSFSSAFIKIRFISISSFPPPPYFHLSFPVACPPGT